MHHGPPRSRHQCGLSQSVPNAGRSGSRIVPAGVLETDQELLEQDPQLKHNRYFQQLDHPEVGKHIVHREAFTLSKSQSDMVRAPLLGEHNEYALKHILGMSDDEIADLIVEGVLE